MNEYAGSSLGAALIKDDVVIAMEIAHLSFKDGTYQNYGAGTNANAFVGGFRMWEAR